MQHRNTWIGISANPDISVLHGGAIIYSTVSDPALANSRSDFGDFADNTAL